MGKLENQRDEIHRVIWKIANDLRGNVNSWDFKDYIFGTIFYRYLSENITHYVNDDMRPENPNFDYARLSDAEITPDFRKNMIEDKGIFIAPSELFENVLRSGKNDPDLNIHLKKIFHKIEASSIGQPSEPAFRGLFSDFDVNSNKLGNDPLEINKKLYKVLQRIGEIRLSERWSENTIDTFGDAYEFLMGMYSSSAGSKSGEFFTPQPVSELLMRICLLGQEGQLLVYDPTCGSGSLLLQAVKLAGIERINELCGQESNPTTYSLCRMNMLLHNMPFTKFEINCGDTLLNPAFRDPTRKFNVVVSNPPYSAHWEGEDNPRLVADERFKAAGVLAPKLKADLAFVMHALSYLSERGTAAIVCFPGVMYRSGREKKIREYLIQNNFVDAVIQLPENLFFGTNIATSILVLKKNKRTRDILFIDASTQFVKEGVKNRLTDENIQTIVTWYKDRTDSSTTKLVQNDAVSDGSLYVANYVQRVEEEAEIDIDALNAELAKIVAEEDRLRAEIDQAIQEIEREFLNKK